MSGRRQNTGTDLMVVEPPRMPMPVEASQRGLDGMKWRALVDAIYPAAETPGAVLLAVDYCRARNLDPFKRAVHIVPMYNSKLRRTVETVWPGIGELRTTAARTGVWAGNDHCQFGRLVRETFTASKRYQDQKGAWQSLNASSPELMFPEWAQFTVYRMVQGVRVPFVGPKVFFKETFSGQKGLRVPNERWQQSPRQMLEKCAEAAALRRAFPEELAGEYAAEEMEGQTVRGDVDPAVAKYHYQSDEEADGGDASAAVDDGDADRGGNGGDGAAAARDIGRWKPEKLAAYMKQMRTFFGSVATLDALDAALAGEQRVLKTLPAEEAAEAQALERAARDRIGDLPVEHEQDNGDQDEQGSGGGASAQTQGDDDPVRDEPAYVRNLRLRLDDVQDLDGLDGLERAERRTISELPAWVAKLAEAAIAELRRDLQAND